MNRLILLVFCAGTAFYVHFRALPLHQLTAEEEREGNSDFLSEISNDVSRWILQSRVSQFITHHSELKNRLNWISQSSQWGQKEESQGSKQRRKRLVFGQDERICNYDIPDQLPYSALGRVGYGCTGFLLSPDIVMTAAHCIYDAKSRNYLTEYGYDLDFYHRHRRYWLGWEQLPLLGSKHWAADVSRHC